MAFNLGGARVLIFGGSNNEYPKNTYDIYDLTCECIEPAKLLPGKLYLPGVYDPHMGQLNSFLGYCDSVIDHQ